MQEPTTVIPAQARIYTKQFLIRPDVVLSFPEIDCSNGCTDAFPSIVFYPYWG